MLFLEHKHLLRQPYTVDPFPPADYVDPVRRGRRPPPGRRLHHRHVGRDGREVAAGGGRGRRRDGLEVEVIDLRTISPWDRDSWPSRVARTHRLLVVHEDVLTAGFGAEVAAWAAEHCFTDLDAPVRRVAALDTHVAYEPTLEDAILPQVDDIHTALRRPLRLLTTRALHQPRHRLRPSRPAA